MRENQKLKWKIEVYCKADTPDAVGQSKLEDIADSGVASITSVRTAKVYWLEGELQIQEVVRVCSELLADPVTEDYVYQKSDGCSDTSTAQDRAWIVEVRLKPGVTDAVGDSVVKGVRDLGISGINAAHTGQKYWIDGTSNSSTIEAVVKRLLANKVIQTFAIEGK